MDPDATLEAIREGVRYLEDDAYPPLTVDEYNSAVEQLRQDVDALDNWLSRGGFLPIDWQR